MERKQVFQKMQEMRHCSQCGRAIPRQYEGDRCPICEEYELFSHVKEFIRAQDVNEYEVAREFSIPVSRVRKWIKEGRIEYKVEEKEEEKNIRSHCIGCGKPTQFGSYCQSCLRKKNAPKVLYHQEEQDTKMRFLEVAQEGEGKKQ